ncbi:MAG TPA: ABC transporter substrate-binding protein, partial [Kaistia sp.]|nr:ABC transporter substrate-binding protein [Kaistia sp.]
MVAWRSAALAAVLAGGLIAPANAGTLRWAPQRDIVSMDPYSFGDTFTLSVLNHVYEGLVRYDDKLQIEPALAESWEVVNPTTWRFHLRKGVKYHDGANFTADDVLASLKRVSDPTSPLRGNVPSYVSSKKVDDYTVDIVVTENYPLLLNDLTNIHIFDQGWLVANKAEAPTDVAKGVEGYATSHANGTGPFKFISRKPDAETVFEVNPNWWDKRKHNVDRIVMTPITSAATRVAALISGEIDFTNQAPLQD